MQRRCSGSRGDMPSQAAMEAAVEEKQEDVMDPVQQPQCSQEGGEDAQVQPVEGAGQEEVTPTVKMQQQRSDSAAEVPSEAVEQTSHDWKEGERIGEATNPGPASAAHNARTMHGWIPPPTGRKPWPNSQLAWPAARGCAMRESSIQSTPTTQQWQPLATGAHRILGLGRPRPAERDDGSSLTVRWAPRQQEQPLPTYAEAVRWGRASWPGDLSKFAIVRFVLLLVKMSLPHCKKKRLHYHLSL